MEDIDLKLKALKLEEACTESTNKKIREIMKNIQLIDFYGDDMDDIDQAMIKVGEELTAIKEEVTSVITTIQTSYRTKFNSVPDSVTETNSSLERLSIFATRYLENRQCVYDKTKAIRVCYSEAIVDIDAYVQRARAQLQENSSLPIVALDRVNILLNQFSKVKSRLDSARRNGLLIAENTKKAEEKQSIPRFISYVEDELNKIKSRLLDREVQIIDAIRGLDLFGRSQRNVRQWIENRNTYLSLDTDIIRLQLVKEKLVDLQRFNSTKIYEDIIKNMRKKLNKISEVCNIEMATDLLDNIERDDRSTDFRIVTELAMLKELVKEWELCEIKIKELATRFYKPNFKKMALKNQMKTSGKMKLDLSVQKTNVLTALEKLQFYLRSPIDSTYQRAKGEQSVQGELKTFRCQDGERYELVLVCVKEEQKDSASKAEHKLKLSDNPSVDVEEKEAKGTKTG